MKKGDYIKSKFGVIRQIYAIDERYIYFIYQDRICKVKNDPEMWSLTTYEEYKEWLKKNNSRTR